MSEEEVKAEILDKVERLYSAVNRMRFYREVAMENEVKTLLGEAERLRKDMGLTEDEVERLADDLDEYYISGASPYGELDPLTHWVNVVYGRVIKT
ncbi:MAG: hypothetical protein RMK31_05205 [Candidatus Caldarchaeum sp.]|nr:hypothetical protein [Candidatus Caldarchaeum sp.]MDW7978311.1 hypothetical protein [Candidatus Caldarchaeum sp.]MDW8359967.1 hypothetical protein [Candidatus Caldarchaeum sp.]